MMKKFNDFTDDKESFEEFRKNQLEDDNALREYFNNCSHREFNFALLNLGTLLNTVSTYFSFVQEQVDEALTLGKQARDRRMNKIVNDLNEKINDRYDFDKDMRVIKGIVLYNNELYLYITKRIFIKTLQLKDMNW